MNHQAYKDFGNVSLGRLFINKELLPRLVQRLPDSGAKVLNVGVHKYWDYSCLFNHPGKLCDYAQMDTHPGGGDQPAPEYNMSIETCDAIPDNTFDMIVMVGVFEYLDHKEQAFAHIHRMLKPGGFALLSVPGKGYYPDDNRSLDPKDAFVRLAPLRVDEVYVTYEKREGPPTAIHVVCSKS